LYDQIKVKNTIIILASFWSRQLLADIKKIERLFFISFRSPNASRVSSRILCQYYGTNQLSRLRLRMIKWWLHWDFPP